MNAKSDIYSPAGDPTVVVLCGGTSAEREVSLGSGRACALALARSFATRMIDVTADAAPAGIDPAREIVFSTLHGTFGEDGGMQTALDDAGVIYAGCDAASSRLTMDKTVTKETVAAAGVAVAPGFRFEAEEPPADSVIESTLGSSLVLKPNAEGSSVGLHVISNMNEWRAALREVRGGTWLVEKRIVGRELSVGVVEGRALGVVEIRPKSGMYDYASKYTKGLTEYFAPAPLSAQLTGAVQRSAERAFEACGCRDYARVDFMLSDAEMYYLLEINTLPGMKETSLLPMSARCAGWDFTALVRELVTPALRRFRAATPALYT